MYHYSSACYYLVKHGWLHVSTLLKVPLLQRQCLSHHGVVEQMKLQPWVKAAARRKVAASHGRFLHCDNEPSTVVIESESVFGFEMVIKGEAETESLEANTNMTAASFKPLVLVLVNDSWKRTAAFGVMKFLTLASALHSWVSSLWSSLVTLQISLVNVPLRCRLDKVASRSVEQVSGTGEAPANPSPLIAVDASLRAAVGDSWCLPGGSSVCLCWWFATHREYFWIHELNRNARDPPPLPATDAKCSQKRCREAATSVTKRLWYWFRGFCNYLQETSADGAQLKMKGNTGSLVGITGPVGCRVSYFHTNNLIFGCLPNT